MCRVVLRGRAPETPAQTSRGPWGAARSDPGLPWGRGTCPHSHPVTSLPRAAELMTRTSSVVTLEVAKQGAIYHGLATLLNQPSPMMQRSKGGGGAVSSRAAPACCGPGSRHDLFQHSQTLRGRPCCVHCPDSREEREDEHPRARSPGWQAHGFPGPRLGVASRPSDTVLIYLVSQEPLTAPAQAW